MFSVTKPGASLRGRRLCMLDRQRTRAHDFLAPNASSAGGRQQRRKTA